MMVRNLKPVVLKARIKQTASMIFLHGIGDTGHGWASVLNTVRPDHLKVICPTAPTIPITLNLGFRMPAWFDIESMDFEQETDIEGVKESAKVVFRLLDAEVRSGIPSQKIIVGGFSQGGALALYCALNYEKPLGGCIALSTFFPDDKFPDIASSKNKDIPFFQAHGVNDHILPLKYGMLTSTKLKSHLSNHEFKTYNIQHECSDRELSDVKNFIESIVGH